MVGQLRVAYSKHLGDPAWTHFIRRLEAESPAFAEAWAAHDVAQPTGMVKNLRHPSVGRITVTSTSFAVNAVPGARMTVYTPADEQSKKAVARLAAGEELTPASPAGPPIIQNVRCRLSPHNRSPCGAPDTERPTAAHPPRC